MLSLAERVKVLAQCERNVQEFQIAERISQIQHGVSKAPELRRLEYDIRVAEKILETVFQATNEKLEIVQDLQMHLSGELGREEYDPSPVKSEDGGKKSDRYLYNKH
jgi:hypothetical protein